MHDLFSLFMLGLVYGSTVCSLSCMPYFAPYLMGTGNGFSDGLFSSLAFATGKLSSYTLLGGIAAVLGSSVSLDHQHKVIAGVVMMAIALTLPLVNRGGCCKPGRGLCKKGSMFVLGVISSSIPCPPLVAVFLLAAESGSVLTGLSYGLFYGLGLTVSPMLILGGGFAMISGKIQQEARGFAPYMQGLAMLIMMVMAANMIMTA